MAENHSIPDPLKVDPPKVNPEDLALRTPPRPVTRINRRVLMALVGLGGLLILGATIFALDPPSLFDRTKTGSELYNVTNKQTPEGLQGLPSRYSDLPPPPVELGPPLPGDLGGPIVELERGLGIGTPARTAPDLPFRPNPENDALRAERIRQARLVQQARESGVFFQLASRQGGQVEATDTASNVLPASSTAVSGNSFDGVKNRDGQLRLGLSND